MTIPRILVFLEINSPYLRGELLFLSVNARRFETRWEEQGGKMEQRCGMERVQHLPFLILSCLSRATPNR